LSDSDSPQFPSTTIATVTKFDEWKNSEGKKKRNLRNQILIGSDSEKNTSEIFELEFDKKKLNGTQKAIEFGGIHTTLRSILL
jgi:hypothetical protein